MRSDTPALGITSYGINEGGIKMAKCLRCGAGNEWIEGDSRKAPLSFNASVSRWKKLADVKPEKKLKALFMRDGEIFQGWWSVRHECFYTREKVVIEKVELWMPIFSFG